MSFCPSVWFNRAFHTRLSYLVQWTEWISMYFHWNYLANRGLPIALFFYHILYINSCFHPRTINMLFHFRCQCHTYKNGQEGQTSSDRYTLRPFILSNSFQQQLISRIDTDWQPVTLNIGIPMNQILLPITLHLHRQHQQSKTLRASIRHIYDWCG